MQKYEFLICVFYDECQVLQKDKILIPITLMYKKIMYICYT
mgnify:CR=1 FL=1